MFKNVFAFGLKISPVSKQESAEGICRFEGASGWVTTSLFVSAVIYYNFAFRYNTLVEYFNRYRFLDSSSFYILQMFV